MRIKSQKDFWSGVMFVVIGISFAWGATSYTFGSSARPGPGYFPLGLGVLLALLGALVLFKALTIETEGGDPVGAIAWRPLCLIVGAVALSAVLPKLGMVATLPLVIIVASLAGDEFHWRDVLITSFVLTLGCWLVFVKGLSLTIPLWPSFIASAA
ncbi:MAG TPA: tripartite tricarboxylate transporter TctB family protein [Burkholderiaceae bacterium]|nr:tripartite tricarboxylate transporter TctB family protein [Burkholderiaceae bacterium]